MSDLATAVHFPNVTRAAATEGTVADRIVERCTSGFRRRQNPHAAPSLAPFLLLKESVIYITVAYASVSAARLFHLFGQSGKDLEEVSHDPEVGHAKNRGFRVLIDGNDMFG